jgi:hypothetical protein
MTRYLVIAAIFLLTGIMSVVGYFVGEYDEQPIAMAFLFGFMTILPAGGITYLVYYQRSMNKLDLHGDELDDKEVVWAKTAQSMVHYKSGNQFKFWETVGGKLFLTDQVLEFRANPAEFFVYRLIIPLKQVARATPVRLFGIIPGALRIERHDGSFELFTFGAAFDLSVEWANAIMDFRDDLGEREGKA